MASMNVSLPDPMREWIEQQTQSGRYDNASEYMRDLIRHDQDRLAKIKATQALIDEAMESGYSDKTLGQIRDEARKIAMQNTT